MIKENYHTHTHFCDGKNSPEEMVLKAIELNFDYLGFSGHGHTRKESSYCMSPENTKKYFSEITALKEKYKDKIEILCGIEQDIISSDDISYFDYAIGSTHYVIKDNKFYNVDGSMEEFDFVVNEIYKGEFLKFAEEYFENVKTVVDKTNCQIIGHFDLISKNFERKNIKESDKYLYFAEDAVNKLVKYDIPFEINTGAIARGYRTTPYPSENILQMIKNKNGKIIFSSDCHNKDFLNCYFSEAETLTKKVGFKKRSILTLNGFKEIDL